MKEDIPTEGIEATTATGGGHQNSSNQDQQKENAGSEEQSERVNDNNEEGEFGRVTDTKVSSEKPKVCFRYPFQQLWIWTSLKITQSMCLDSVKLLQGCQLSDKRHFHSLLLEYPSEFNSLARF